MTGLVPRRSTRRRFTHSLVMDASECDDLISANGMVRPCSCPASDKLSRVTNTLDVACGSNPEKLYASICFPLFT
jgi:hypothetical protein